MNRAAFRSWQGVQDEVLRRIHAREWKPGDMIPNESDLALEFGCARSTVNRALRSLAESGLLDRRRKAGTRVATQPVAKATLDIAVIRHDVENRGRKYGYQRIVREIRMPPLGVSAAMQTDPQSPLIYVRALHFSDDMPYALETRWINPVVVPAATGQDFRTVSANEWLLQNAPYTDGEISFSAVQAEAEDAEDLGHPIGSALFAIDRLTWDTGVSVTKVKLLFAPGHQLRTVL